jgi:hypothetical protein
LEIVAILVASIAAIALVHLEILPENIEISFILLLLAVHTLHEITNGEEVRRDVETLKERATVPASDLVLVKPADIARRTKEFGLRNTGEDWWFNACPTMFRSQEVFDTLVKSSMLNPKTTRIFFVLSPSMKDAWQRDVAPKIERSKGREKVQPVLWREMGEGIAFRTIDVDGLTGAKEALLTVWGEPFMMEQAGERGTARMPRYVIHVRSDSELLVRLSDLLDRHRLDAAIQR